MAHTLMKSFTAKPSESTARILIADLDAGRFIPRFHEREKFMRASQVALIATLATILSSSTSDAAIIYASGQNNGDPSHNSGNYYYRIDTTTGLATPVSPLLTGGSVSALAGSSDGRLLGFSGGRVGEVNPFTGTFTPVGANNGLTVTGFDVYNGSGYGVPVSGSDRRLHRIDLTDSTATPFGDSNAIGSALDTFFANASGTNIPFIIGLGSVSNTLYGVHLGAGKNNLVALNPIDGSASVLGAVNAVGTSGNPGEGRYSGFAAMTGIDESGDGIHDALFGNVNFFDPDAAGPLPSQRIGGVARYDLIDGTWSLIGTNPGLIFFGFGSTVPAPGAATLLGMCGLFAAGRRRG